MSLKVLQNPGADAQDSAWEPRHSPSVDHKFLLWPIQRPLSLLLSTAPLSCHSITTTDRLLADMALFKALSPLIKHFCGWSSSAPRVDGAKNKEPQETLRWSIPSIPCPPKPTSNAMWNHYGQNVDGKRGKWFVPPWRCWFGVFHLCLVGHGKISIGISH